ncbi:MAG: sigma-70 family RNA polymerase sigma factor [Dysgonamonadaceae bacterium]|jgi:RNA polymerase sigma factor (sigma-70 family)|nr:sigma-70 family RNA polymerase sigma factor [Dysgonamonadaceae bacterium]
MLSEDIKYYSNLSDLELRDTIISGDKNAVEYLVCVKCVSSIEHHLKKLLGNTWDLDEGINDIFVLLLEKNYHRLKKYEGRASLKTYTSTIAYNYFLNEAMKEQKWLRIRVDSVVDDSIINKAVGESTDSDEIRNLEIKVKTTLKRMPNQRYQFILYKSFFENKAPNEIAEELGISLPVYYNKFHLAKKQFKYMYNKYNDNEQR